MATVKSKKRGQFAYQRLGFRKMSSKKGSCDQRIIGREMHLFKKGKLKSGNGRKVTNPKQAIAIALSVARTKCKGPSARRSRRRSTKRRTRKH